MNPIPSPLAGLSILVVDDEIELCRAIAYEFQRRACKTIVAANGNEAVAIFRREQVDIIISDVRMPNGTGVDLLMEVRKTNPTIPLIFLVTGFADLSPEEAQTKGASALIQKPFDRKAFIDLVEGYARSMQRPKKN